MNSTPSLYTRRRESRRASTFRRARSSTSSSSRRGKHENETGKNLDLPATGHRAVFMKIVGQDRKGGARTANRSACRAGALITHVIFRRRRGLRLYMVAGSPRREKTGSGSTRARLGLLLVLLTVHRGASRAVRAPPRPPASLLVDGHSPPRVRSSSASSPCGTRTEPPAHDRFTARAPQNSSGRAAPPAPMGSTSWAAGTPTPTPVPRSNRRPPAFFAWEAVTSSSKAADERAELGPWRAPADVFRPARDPRTRLMSATLLAYVSPFGWKTGCGARTSACYERKRRGGEVGNTADGGPRRMRRRRRRRSRVRRGASLCSRRAQRTALAGSSSKAHRGAEPTRHACAAPPARRHRATSAAADQRRKMGHVGRENVVGGFNDYWKQDATASSDEGPEDKARERYARHLLMPEVGEAGQIKLNDAKLTMRSAQRRLGSPAARRRGERLRRAPFADRGRWRGRLAPSNAAPAPPPRHGGRRASPICARTCTDETLSAAPSVPYATRVDSATSR